MKRILVIGALLTGFAGSGFLCAQEALSGAANAVADTVPAAASGIDGSSTAWMLVAALLVLFMTMPGLGMFYGGLVKRKNVLSVMMQSFTLMGVVTILWFSVGYSLVFSTGNELIPGFLGNFSRAFMNGIGPDSTVWALTSPVRIPEILFSLFQCMFAVITPALITGAFAERMKFQGFLAFSVAWLFLVYIPIAHAVWNPEGFFFRMGALDYAGGTVVHVSAGIAALVASLMLGKRKNLKATPPHNLTYTLLGAAMLWVGWFGFNAGSGLAADGVAVNAFMVTHLSAATATVVWVVIDWIIHGKPTILGAASGAVAGLVAITPAAGFVGIEGAMAIGAASGVVCWLSVTLLKPRFGYDDSLDAFGVHGVGGILGALLTGIFASPVVATAWHPHPDSGIAVPPAGLLFGNPGQFGIQLAATAFALVLSASLSALILFVVGKVAGLRVNEMDESMGLDISQHNERAYTVIE